MAQSEKFTVSVVVKIEGDQGFSASTEQNWGDMDYDFMQITQRTILKSLMKSFIALGDARVTDQKSLALADSLVGSLQPRWSGLRPGRSMCCSAGSPFLPWWRSF